ncbi:MAG: hypothetical protein ABL963_04900 [Longimicrobiales bacterium]
MRFSSWMACAVVLTACSSGGGAGEPADPAAPSGDLHMTVVNRAEANVAVFVVWSSGRSRLGDVAVGRTREFTTPFRAGTVALGIDISSVPPAGTSSAPSGFNATTGAREGNMLVSGGYTVDPGDVLYWEIRRISPRLDVFVREVLP